MATPAGLVYKAIHLPPVSFHFTGGYLRGTPNGVFQQTLFISVHKNLFFADKTEESKVKNDDLSFGW
jgi:hypothetical protein